MDGRVHFSGVASGRRPDSASRTRAHHRLCSECSSQSCLPQLLLLVDRLFHHLFSAVSALSRTTVTCNSVYRRCFSVYRGRSDPVSLTLAPSANECLIQASLINSVQPLWVFTCTLGIWAVCEIKCIRTACTTIGIAIQVATTTFLPEFISIHRLASFKSVLYQKGCRGRQAPANLRRMSLSFIPFRDQTFLSNFLLYTHLACNLPISCISRFCHSLLHGKFIYTCAFCRTTEAYNRYLARKFACFRYCERKHLSKLESCTPRYILLHHCVKLLYRCWRSVAVSTLLSVSKLSFHRFLCSARAPVYFSLALSTLSLIMEGSLLSPSRVELSFWQVPLAFAVMLIIGNLRSFRKLLPIGWTQLLTRIVVFSVYRLGLLGLT